MGRLLYCREGFVYVLDYFVYYYLLGSYVLLGLVDVKGR